MSQKGWWDQIQTDDYRDGKTAYGDPRAMEADQEKRKADSGIAGRSALQCTECGHRREFDENFERTIRRVLKMNPTSPITAEALRGAEREFCCTSCKRRGKVIFIRIR